MADFNPFDLGAKAQPGIRRDGTGFASPYYSNGQWVRFQRGMPRKMGGYSAISDVVDSPVRYVHLDSRGGQNRVHLFSPWGIEQVSFDNLGGADGPIDRTPAGFTPQDAYCAQADTLYDSGGSGNVYLLAHFQQSLAAIDSDVALPVYYGDVAGTGALTPILDQNGVPISVSGGVCVLQPFAFIYGSNGLIWNSDANDITSTTAWEPLSSNASNIGNFAATKIVKGLPIRGGGNAPAGLFWALDSLVRVSYIGSPANFRYDPQGSLTVLSSNGIIEYDGLYFWPGVDRFYYYDGGSIKELPNNMNLNWFFDNLNPANRQKVCAVKVPRWGEIWWLFPFGEDNEVSAAVIFNVRESLWYDTRIVRTAGAEAGVFPRPVMTGGNSQDTARVSYTALTGVFSVGDSIKGTTSGARGTIAKIRDTVLNLTGVSGEFQSGETINNSLSSGTAHATVGDSTDQLIDTLWQHEFGTDQVIRDSVTAIPATFETPNFQWMTGGLAQNTPQGDEAMMRINRIEPDFRMTGVMAMQVSGKAYAHSETVISDPIPFDGTTEYLTLEEQRREMTLIFSSNEVGGTFETGRILVSVDEGDGRP